MTKISLSSVDFYQFTTDCTEPGSILLYFVSLPISPEWLIWSTVSCSRFRTRESWSQPQERSSCVFGVPRYDSLTPYLVVDQSRLNADYCSGLLALHPGAWFVTLDLQNACCHILIDLRYLYFLAVKVKDTDLHFMVLPFSFNIALKVFTKTMKPMANAPSNLG